MTVSQKSLYSIRKNAIIPMTKNNLIIKHNFIPNKSSKAKSFSRKYYKNQEGFYSLLIG